MAMLRKKKDGDLSARGLRTEFRYFDREHHDLVHEAAKKAGLSANAWIVACTLKQAKRELRDEN